MKTLWVEKSLAYDGSQLHSLYNYLNHKVLGNSCVAFRGPCRVSFDHMLDGEDLLDRSLIQGDDMLHFIIEVFDQPLLSGVFLQRLFAGIVKDKVAKLSSEDTKSLLREGDDIYWNNGKFSISIAAKSPQSVLVHFAVNVSNKGTPVKTCSLEDLKIDVRKFALECLDALAAEFASCVEASQKVKPVS